VDPDRAALRKAVLATVENQLNENDPPETRQTYERLLAAGHTVERAKELIGSAVAEEIWHVMFDQKPFDIKRFRRFLNKLK
jgi:hypothetical protein